MDLFSLLTLYICTYSIEDTPAPEQSALLLRKLQQCCVMFNFDDPLADVKSKEVKRGTLNELVTSLNEIKGLLTDPVCSEIVHMVDVICFLYSRVAVIIIITV